MSTDTLVWEASAVTGLLRVRAADPAMAKDPRSAVSALAGDPEPQFSTPLGEGGLRRLRIGSGRVLYRVDEQEQAVHVISIGRKGM